MSEVVNIPQLRFPGFNGRWSCELFNNIVSVIDGDRGVNYPKSNDFFSDEYCLFLSAKNVTKNGFIFNETQFIKKERDELLRKGKLSRGDIVLTTRGTVGQFAFYSDEVTYNNIRINSGMVLLRNSNDNLLNSYFFKACNSFQISRQIKIVAFGSAQPQLTVKEINKIKINLPTKPEQQKIAAFLTAVDNKIEQLSKKQALLSEYKKGLMQQIFSQAIRFKADDGIEFPEWEEKKLGGVVDNVGGTALEKYTNPKETHKFISIGNYGVDGKYIDNGQRVELNNKTKTKLLDKDNLVMVLNDKTAAGNIVGSTILIDESDSYIYNQRSERLICKSELFPIFAWHYLNSKIFRKSVYSISQGGTQIYVNFPSVKELNFSLPSLLEQTKIANFLSSIDTKIEQVGGQLDESKQFKKALLQQMFV